MLNGDYLDYELVFLLDGKVVVIGYKFFLFLNYESIIEIYNFVMDEWMLG